MERGLGTRLGIVWVCLLNIMLVSCSEHSLGDFKTKLFKFTYPADDIYDLNFGFAEEEGGYPLAIGDLNSDKAMDIIVVNVNRTLLLAYLYSREGHFSPMPLLKIKDRRIDGAIIIESSNGSKPGLLVTTSSGDKTFMGLYEPRQELNDSWLLMGNETSLLFQTQPFVADIDGDFLQDVIYTSPDKQRMVALRKKTGEVKHVAFSEFASADNGCLSATTIRPFSKPHSAALLDLNGDCQADLFFTSGETIKSFEVWLRRTNPRGSKHFFSYCLVYDQEVPGLSSQVTFTDINRNGRIDMLYTVNNSLVKHLNLLPSPTSTDEDCVAPAANTIFAPIAAIQTSSESFTSLDQTYQGLYSGDVYPPTLRTGDFNIDGYPDLLFTIRTKDLNYSVLCLSKDDPVTLDKCQKIGGESILATFFDLDEDGKLDILEVGVNGNRSEIKTFYQYYNRDSFFLKVMQIEGNHYGEVYYGTTYQYVYTDLEGERHIGVGVQAPQNSHSALQVPYGLVGIGRSSNYIEHLLIAYPVSTSPNTRVWSPIIPNSQIIVSSYASPSNKWKIELFVNPSSKLSIIIIIVIFLLIVLIVIIGILYYREKLEDEASGQQIQLI